MKKKLSNILPILFSCIIVVNCLAQNTPIFQLAKPRIISNQTLFTDSTFVKLELDMEGVLIYYTLDGGDPSTNAQFYSKPICLTKSKTLKAIAIHNDCQPSAIAKMGFYKARKVHLLEASIVPMPHDSYAGDGVSSLTDHQKGSIDFKDGKWLGVAKQDMEVNCTFLDTIELNSLTISTISDPKSWIFPPQGIEVWSTNEKGDFVQVADLEIGVLKEMETPNLQFHTCTFTKQKTTQLKVLIKNTATIPDWHLRAGKGSWLFVDELIFEPLLDDE